MRFDNGNIVNIAKAGQLNVHSKKHYNKRTYSIKIRIKNDTSKDEKK